MECMLLPKDPTSRLSKVPYVAHERYDGGDWLSYPERKYPSQPPMIVDDKRTIVLYFARIDIGVTESFLQTWLFFGLLSEFFGGNASHIEDDVLAEGNRSVSGETANEVVDLMYEEFLNREDGGWYITTKSLLKRMGDEVQRGLADHARLIKRFTRLQSCLEMAFNILLVLKNDFDPRIRASISAVGELLAYSVGLTFSKFNINCTTVTGWHLSFFRRDPVKHRNIMGPRETMLDNGWCPSDISRSFTKFTSLQTLHFLSLMSKLNPRGVHQDCDNVECRAYQTKKDDQISHVTPLCSCSPIAVDNSIVIDILEEEESVPLLRFIGDTDSIRIGIEPSSKETSYVAISHVSHFR